jgi:radical SAM protein with 4Fe4S-binding SPASM domain
MIKELQKYEIIADIDLSPWRDLVGTQRILWLEKTVQSVYKECYDINQRIVFQFLAADVYATSDSKNGMFIQELQSVLNKVDISNFFVVLVTSDATIKTAYEQNFQTLSTDSVPINIVLTGDLITEKTLRGKKYNYVGVDPLKLDLDDVSERKKFLLTESKTFCMYPWIHIHAYPTGQTYPCCMADMSYPVGNTRKHSLETIWNQENMREIRRSMIDGSEVQACNKCYEQESNGFFSGRRSANKHHGHHIDLVDETQADGTLERFEMTYWDIRFSNLCNLKCRSCGHIFSSQWYQDQAKIAGPEWKDKNTVLNYAGRTETDMWEQLEPHLDYVEQIYFAGGEPLLMEEHYHILDELVRRKRFDVRLIYNTNFTHTELKGQSVFEYWKQFDSVAVGASLDDSGARGEYIRKGTDWAVVEQNRKDMLRICPEVDFYISPTLSIMNAWHLPDFHRDWVEKGLIRAQDLNVNILQDPAYYRIDIATAEYKQLLRVKFEEHIAWLKTQGDNLGRATVGFESAVSFMMATDNTHLIDTFWRKTHELDGIRKENILDIIPELKALT